MLEQAKKKRYRDYILMLIMARTGVRVSEVVKLRKQDVQENTVIVRQGKGKKDRVIPLEKELSTILGLFSDRLTPSQKLFPISERQVRNIVYRYAPDGLEIHPHTFRHSFAVHCLKNGMNIRNLQKILGHTNLTTTQVYLDLTAADVQDDFGKVKW
jgi:integrase/recombinase XerC/integrase/recombinase XerD